MEYVKTTLANRMKIEIKTKASSKLNLLSKEGKYHEYFIKTEENEKEILFYSKNNIEDSKSSIDFNLKKINKEEKLNNLIKPNLDFTKILINQNSNNIIDDRNLISKNLVKLNNIDNSDYVDSISLIKKLNNLRNILIGKIIVTERNLIIKSILRSTKYNHLSKIKYIDKSEGSNNNLLKQTEKELISNSFYQLSEIFKDKQVLKQLEDHFENANLKFYLLGKFFSNSNKIEKNSLNNNLDENQINEMISLETEHQNLKNLISNKNNIIFIIHLNSELRNQII